MAAGIGQGDVIVSWNGKPIEHLKTLLRSLGPSSVGETVAIGLKRAGAATEVSFRIAERPAG
jgi:S1-C subfamily serine protease